MSNSIRVARFSWGLKTFRTFHIFLYVLVIFSLWMLYPKGYTFSDPVAYLARAKDLNNILTWEFNHPFDHRLSLLLSHWLSFKIFGINTFSAYFPQIAIFCIILAGVLQRVESNTSRIYAFSILLLLLPHTVEVYPDLGAAAFMFLAVLILEQRDSAWRGLLFTLFAALAFLFKETAIFLFAPFAWVTIHDLKRRQMYSTNTRRFYVSTATFGVVFIFIYLLTYWFLTGEPMARFNTVDSYGTRHLWSPVGLTDLVSRLFIAPHSFLLGYAGISLALALLGSMIALFGRASNQLMAVYFLSGLLLFIFFSASLSSYAPLPLMDRMVAFLIPPLAVLAADTLPHLSKRMFQKDNARILAQILFTAIALHWSAIPIAKAFYAGKSKLHESREIAASALVNDSNTQLFLAEDRTRGMLSIYLGFRELDQARILVCPSAREIYAADVVFVLVDIARADFLASAYGSETCAQELIAAARASGLTILVDEENLFFAQRDTK